MNGIKKYEVWERYEFKTGKYLAYRTGGPAHIRYYDTGGISYEEYFRDENIVRAIEYYESEFIPLREWYFNSAGEMHREDGPAIIIYNEDGSIKGASYYLDGKHYNDIFKWSIDVGCLKGD